MQYVLCASAPPTQGISMILAEKTFSQVGVLAQRPFDWHPPDSPVSFVEPVSLG